MSAPPPHPGWAPHLPSGPSSVDVDHLGSASLPSRWVARWAADPTRRVVFDEASGWLTAGELEARSRGIAARLAGAGLEAGQRLLVSAGASVELVVAYVAALRLGLVVVPVNTAYRERLEKAGLRFAGMSPDGLLPETVEYPDHPWFIGVQYHPELKSKPFEPHPLFASFVEAAVVQSRLV